MTKPDFSTLTKDNIVDFIGDIFLRRGAESYLGEEVTMSEHMLQGAQIAEHAGADEEAIAAVLLHDIGHYTNEFPEDALEKGVNNYHDEAGARVLKNFFPEPVIECVRQHVAAKRYLCAIDAGYFDRLSEASVHTLTLQGGPMTRSEVKEFERTPHLERIVQVRKWDDAGKIAGAKTQTFADYVSLLQRIVDAHAARAD